MSNDRSLMTRALFGQERVRTLLERAVSSNHITHAYLFVGPAGSGKTEAAYALAQAYLCDQGGCGACDSCIRVARKTHPDVHFIQPQSAQGYLTSQVRSIIEELSFAPLRGSGKVYILSEADRLTASSANALLKSLEEPPDGVVFILLSTTRESVLPTIVSRCQVIQFKPLPASLSAQTLADSLHIPVKLVRRALGCCPSPAQAREFLGSTARQESRRKALDCLSKLPRCDELDVLNVVKEAVLAAKAPLADLKQAQQDALTASEGTISSAALRELEERNKRELTLRERSGIIEQLTAMRCLLRDALMISSHRDDEPVCDDYAQTAREYASALGVDGIVRSLETVRTAQEHIGHGVSPQLVYESMLFTIKEMFACRP